MVAASNWGNIHIMEKSHMPSLIFYQTKVRQKRHLRFNKHIWFLNSIKVVPQAHLPCLQQFSCLILPDSIICPGWPMFGSKSVKYKNELRSNRTSLKLQIFRSMMAFLPRYLNYLFSILYIYIENVHLTWYLWTVFLNTCYHFSAHWAFGGEFPVLPCTVIATDLQNTRYKYENKH